MYIRTTNLIAFSSGICIGFIIGGVFVTKKFLENKTVAEVIAGDISKKVIDSIYEDGNWRKDE